MKIIKEIKNVTFEYDEEKKIFTLYDHEGLNGTIELNKVYAFAFMRFVVRISQRNWLRKNKNEKNKLDKVDEIMIESEHEENDPNQLTMFNNE